MTGMCYFFYPTTHEICAIFLITPLMTKAISMKRSYYINPQASFV